ncbi:MULTISPECIES: hypothetical protein [Roseicella]|uniref:Uncharacterized protein n=2 Tax=Roseicella TaxID=2730923 RepID=A0A9X1LCJ5_9PROT|nr:MULTISPECIES: hypothetical protein [Roseicella]MCB4824183.1 hypothetical protein [Roseicella aerolata]RAI56090.1 hypothetical protein DOO78_22890 [Roseicella frigidaeris]
MPTKPHATGKTRAARPRAAAPARAGLPRGYGAMRDVPLELDPRIDLTKPIYEQAAALRKAAPKRPGKPR